MKYAYAVHAFPPRGKMDDWTTRKYDDPYEALAEMDEKIKRLQVPCKEKSQGDKGTCWPAIFVIRSDGKNVDTLVNKDICWVRTSINNALDESVARVMDKIASESASMKKRSKFDAATSMLKECRDKSTLMN